MPVATVLEVAQSIALGVFFLGASIFVHELGHFLAARWRGVRVERFSIGFGPPIVSWRGKDGVDYRISWLPLGGYVALPQLADMSAIEGKAEPGAEALPPPSYSTKVIVFVAGAVFNVLFALALATILWVKGIPEAADNAGTTIGYVAPTLKLPDGSTVASPASRAGLQVGDEIVEIDGRKIANWDDILAAVALGAGRAEDGRREARFVVRREGATRELLVYPELVGSEKDRRVGISPGASLKVVAIKSGSQAEAAGFRPDDVLLSIGNARVLSAPALIQALEAAPAPTQATVRRGGSQVTLTLPAQPEKFGTATFGFELQMETRLVHHNPFAQIADHAGRMVQTLSSWVHPNSDIGLSKFSGPVGIFRMFQFANEAGFVAVLWFTTLINVNLALFNLLPIPVLDGGHILFATIARLRGKALPAQFIATAQSVFMVLLLTMILYVTFHDIRRW
ncbi:RIP metalloprotease RseP [Nibricoccus sp. IMCC34717]|uniref:RIP metalloprotease RseP n=1 Tax=Nibricoccus sp. IMCC34717 TaxID=3034021 RepID=UPI00384DBA42